jgi:hypothetical protein
MGFFDFLFKKAVVEEIDYEKITSSCWDIFRQGFKNPNPEIRRAVEEAVLNVESPDGKRFFSVGMQDPDIRNKIFCIQKVYERGGWRLSESILKTSFEDEELTIEEKEKLIYFLADFSDPEAAEYMTAGIRHQSKNIRIATLCAISGVKGGDKANLIVDRIKEVDDPLEKFCCALLLFQFNKPQGKPILDEFFEKGLPSSEYINKLKYIDFGKARVYIEKVFEQGDRKTKISLIEMIQDNRGIDILIQFLKDSDIEVVKRSIEQVIEIGSRNAYDEVKKISETIDLKNTLDKAGALFGEKEKIKIFQDKVKSLTLNEDVIDALSTIAKLQDQNISEFADKILLSFPDLDNVNNNELEKLNDLIQVLCKYGKISSITILDKYLKLNYLEKEDIIRWKLVCNSAAAILCIVERNTTYYTLKEKMKEQGV